MAQQQRGFFDRSSSLGETTHNINLAMVNANVLTMNPASPLAEAVAISGNRIVAVGSDADIRGLALQDARVVDCQGCTLLPGFNDAHIHLPGLARRLTDLDCSPLQAPSIVALRTLIRGQSGNLQEDRWVRGFGYDDLQLTDRRHPNRHDLDAASPSHPVWLQHRSGHASVLNSRALELATVHRETPDPPGGVIERDEMTGEPTGVLLECESFLRLRLGRIRSTEDFDEGMRAAGRLLTGYGITSVQDAGAENGIERWRSFQRLQANGALPIRITMFAGTGRLDEITNSGIYYGSGDHKLRLGHAKIILTLTSGRLHPAFADLEAMVTGAHRRGFPVALHCVEEEAIAAAAAVLKANRPPGMRDRIEHCSEGIPELVAAVSRSGAMVVTQPGFVYHNGPAYRQNVEARLLSHLYPAGGLMRAGAGTAFGSDAPVFDPNPWPAIYSAVTRQTSDGKPMASNDQHAVSMEQALRAFTLGSAEAEGTSGHKGSIAPEKLADLVLVDRDPSTIVPDDIPGTRTVLSIVDGRVVWGKS